MKIKEALDNLHKTIWTTDIQKKYLLICKDSFSSKRKLEEILCKNEIRVNPFGSSGYYNLSSHKFGEGEIPSKNDFFEVISVVDGDSAFSDELNYLKSINRVKKISTERLSQYIYDIRDESRSPNPYWWGARLAALLVEEDCNISKLRVDFFRDVFPEYLNRDTRQASNFLLDISDLEDSYIIYITSTFNVESIEISALNQELAKEIATRIIDTYDDDENCSFELYKLVKIKTD